ncbi:MAG: hypothetical protein H7068_03625 [Pedobacter sp.]|nr:hypothetical protein [Chitinophagaceae bacterium]
MKTKILLLLVLTCTSIKIVAQDKPSVTATIVNFIKARNNEFADIKGTFVTTDKEQMIDYYNCTQSFGAKIEALSYEKKDNRSRFLSFFDYKDTDELLKATDVLNQVLDAINILASNSPDAKYNGYDYQTASGQDITEIIDNSNGFLVMRIITGKDIKSMSLIFYSSTYGKP